MFGINRLLSGGGPPSYQPMGSRRQADGTLALDFGEEHPTRAIIFSISGSGSAATPYPTITMTLNGVDVPIHRAGSWPNGAGRSFCHDVAAVRWPRDAVQHDVVLSASAPTNIPIFSWYRAINMHSLVPYDSNADGDDDDNPVSTFIDLPAGGIAISAFGKYSAGSATFVGGTSVTDDDYNSGFFRWQQGHHIATSPLLQTARQFRWNFNPDFEGNTWQAMVAAASWR